MMQPKRILVTTALPYANGPLHLGHMAGTFIPADIFTRYHRLKGTDILWVAGSDEHGIPIIIQAKKEGVSPQEVVNRYYKIHKKSLEKCDISFDIYARTSSETHKKTVQAFFLELKEKGCFREKKELQYYDEELDIFLADRYLKGTCPHCDFSEANGDQCERCGSYLDSRELINPKSTLSKRRPILKETSHWYFMLGHFQERLQVFLDERKKTWRPNVINYTQTWIKKGLRDRAITRDMSWGVPLPLEVEKGVNKVLYVWFEAVLGYISATKEWAFLQGDNDLWEKYWKDSGTELIHFIGKDNVVFHTIMFPAMLIAKNESAKDEYILPGRVPASEFMNIEGKKFSKSRGYAIYLHDFLEKFPSDFLRYSIAMNYPEAHDTDFSWIDFKNRINGELADTLGNFVKRVIDFLNMNFEGKVPLDMRGREEYFFELTWSKHLDAIDNAYNEIHIRDGVFESMELARVANRFFTKRKPWKDIKTNRRRAEETISISANFCLTLAIVLYPVIPKSAQKIFDVLNINIQNITWNDARIFSIPAGHQIKPGKADPLFPKIQDSQIDEELQKINSLIATQNNSRRNVKNISFEDFSKVDIRVGTVLECKKREGSKKLLIFKVKIDDDIKQIVSGIAQHVNEESVIGSNVVVVTNLDHRKIRGVVSEGMLLTVESKDKKIYLISPNHEGINGSRVE